MARRTTRKHHAQPPLALPATDRNGHQRRKSPGVTLGKSMAETSETQAAPVAGSVKIMTEEPVELPEDTLVDDLLDGLSEQINRRPWVVPAAIAGGIALYLLLRHRD